MSSQAEQVISSGVIFSADQTSKSAQQYPTIEVTPPYWTPSVADISELNSKLKKYLHESKDAATDKVLTNYADYKIQYLGYSENGKKWILVNAFCKSVWKENYAWHNSVVVVFDGGPCFFQIRYDVESFRFKRFEVNGES